MSCREMSRLGPQDYWLEREKQARPVQGFFPGLLDDLVLQHIATKLSWSSMYALTAVNRAWRRAIRSREIYNLRKCEGVSQQLVVAPVECGTHKGFLDVESQELYLFPLPGFQLDPAAKISSSRGRIPLPAGAVDRKFRTAEGIVVLDEKLFALEESVPLQEVHVLDTAACEMTWKRCSRSTTDRRTDIWVPCNGRIYSFHVCRGRIHGKLYDPENDRWTEIENGSEHFRPNQDFSVPQPRARVAVLGNEIYVGLLLGNGMMVFDSLKQRWRLLPDTLAQAIRNADRDSSYTSRDLVGDMVVIGGKIHNFSRSCVLAYDVELNDWNVMSRTFDINSRSCEEDVLAVSFSGGGLLALLALDRELEYKDVRSRRLCRSVGFDVEVGVEHGSFAWEDVSGFPFANCLGGRAGFLLSQLKL